MNHALTLLRNPLKSPHWGELVCAFLGLVQTGFAMLVFNDLKNRPGYDLTLFFSPEAWTMAGLVLFILHLIPFIRSDSDWSYQARLVATGCSLTFWTHFITSLFINSVMFSTPLPAAIVPAIGMPILAGAVLYRLWRRY